MAGRLLRGLFMASGLLSVVYFLLGVLMWLIIIQAVLSWLVAFNVINTYNDGVRAFLNALERITAPLYRPIQKILPDFGGIDFSPLVVLIIIQALRILLGGVIDDMRMM
jgi:YggT family protein